MDPSRLRTEICEIPAYDASAKGLARIGAAELREKAISHGVPRLILMDLVVSGVRPRVIDRRFIVHQWNGFVPYGSICMAGDGCFVCSPEFCLLQVGRVLRSVAGPSMKCWQCNVILIELCCEFCGTYSKQNTPEGFKTRTKQLTNVSSLMLFCSRMAHEQNVGILRDALTWTLDGLNSPMETVLYLFLCLPSSYGGLALPRPLSNYRLEVPHNLWGRTRLRHIIPDLFWPEARLIVEYNGKESHHGREVEDQERQELAHDMGHTVITFRKEDILNKERFMAKAQSVARHLGRALPPQSEKFKELQGLLHNMLLRSERWI